MRELIRGICWWFRGSDARHAAMEEDAYAAVMREDDDRDRA